MSESRLKKLIRSFASIFAVSIAVFFVLTNLVFAAGALDQNNQFNSLKILSRKQAFLLLSDPKNNVSAQELADFLAQILPLPNQSKFFSGGLSLPDFAINPEQLVSKIVQKTGEAVAPFRSDFFSTDSPLFFPAGQNSFVLSKDQQLTLKKIIGKIQSLGFNSQPESFSGGLSLPDFAINPEQLVQKIFQKTGEVAAPFRTNFLAPGEPSIFLVKQTPPAISDQQKLIAKNIFEKIKSLFGLSFFFSKQESQMVNNQLNNNQIDEKLINLLVSRISAKLPQLQQVIKETRVETQTQIKETKTLVDQEKIQELANLLTALQAKEESDRQALFQSIALSNRINSLNGVTISNPTFASGAITDADVPDTITASRYLPLAGGILSGATYASSTFQVTGDVRLYGALTVDGATNLGSIVVSNSVISNDLTVGGNAYINGGNLNLGTGSATTTLTSASGKLGIGSTSPAQLLGVQGNVFISGNISNVANITATGTLNVTGVTTLTNASTTGMLTIGNGFISAASSTLSSSLQIAGQLYASSTLSVASLASLNGAFISVGSSTVAGSLQVAGPLSASSTLTISGLEIQGSGFISQASSTISSSLNISGQLYASSTLSVAGLVTLNDGLLVNSSSTFKNILNVTGNLYASSTLNVGGLANLSGFISNSSSTISNSLNVAGQLYASSTLSVASLASLNGAFISVGSSTVAGSLQVAGPLSASSTLTISGLEIQGSGFISQASSTVAGPLTVSGQLNASSSLLASFISIATSTPPATNSGINLAVQGNVLFSGNLSLSNLIATSSIGIGSTTPYGLLTLQGSANQTSPMFTVASSSGDVFFQVNAVGSTTIEQLQTGALTFDSNAGLVSWIDLPITPAAATGTIEGYSAMLNGSTTLTVFGQSNGSGSVYNQKVGIGSSTPWGVLSVERTDATTSPMFVVSQISASDAYFIVTSGKSVGVGTSTPGNNFSVQGNILSSGNLNAANITATGTLTVTGLSTLASASTTGMLTIGTSFIASASSTVASSFQVSGLESQYLGFISSASSTVAGSLQIAGQLYASSTLSVASLASLNSGFVSVGSSTVAGIFNVNGPLNASSSLLATFIAIGTTTPPATTSGINLAVQGNVLFSGNLNLASLIATSSIGIGSTTPYGFLTIQSQIGTALPLVTVASSSGDSFFSISSTGTTTIQTLKTGTLTFDTNAGVVPWVDLPINSFAATNSVQSYSALLNGSTTLTVWGQSAGTPQGISVITNQKVGVGSSTPWGILSVERTDATTSPIFVVSSMSTGTPFFIVANNGNIGIATATPWGMLSIDRTIATTAPLFVVSNESTTTPYFIIANNGYVGIGTTSPGFLLSVAGNIGTTQCVKSATSTFGIGPADCTDIAESYVAGEDLEPGDIVALGDGSPLRLVKATSNSKTILGAVSGHPAVLFEGSMSSFGAPAVQSVYQSGDKAPLALAGRILVKVNLDNGPIQAGDPIAASSEAGIGQKASTSGMIIGYALEDYSGPTDQNNSEVLIIASLQNWNPPVKVTSDVQNIGGNAGTSEVQNIAAIIIDTVKSWLADMKVTIEDGLVTLKNLVAETITANQLELKDKATGDFYCVTINNGELEKTLGKCGQ